MNFYSKNKELIHSKTYFWAIVLLVISMPLSVFGMSLSQFILAGNWLIEGKFRKKWSLLKASPDVWVFMGLFFIHIIWLFNTSDFTYAFKDIRIKLPLLLLPLILGTTEKLNKSDVIKIIFFFIASLVVASFISIGILFGLKGKSIVDYRDLSIFISHIRFSLLVNVGIFLVLYFILRKCYLKHKKERIIHFILLFYFFIFLIILRSQTGLVVFAITSLILTVYFTFKSKKVIIKIALLLLFIIPSTTIVFYVYRVISDYQNVYEYKAENLTVNGNSYAINLLNNQRENGYKVYDYCCFAEIEKEWNKRSDITYKSIDLSGNQISGTLVRYLTSLGLKKDSASIWLLTEKDIRNIKEGIPNYLYGDKLSLYSYIHQQYWQIDMYFKGNNPSGHSTTQRIEYLKAAFSIINKHFWLGTGTGDVNNSYKEYYILTNSNLEKERQLRSHNQFVAFFLTFGLIGFLLSLIALFYPIIRNWRSLPFPFVVSLIIGFLSFFNEDTLETQAGVTFFAFFYVFFLFKASDK